MSRTHEIAKTIASLLEGKSVTFAQLEYVTDVKTAAKHKDIKISKQTSANVQLFANVRADVYANAVRRSAAQDATNDATDIAEFTTSENYFKHSAECYSIVEHRQNAKLYLYCIYNNAKSVYTINGQTASRAEVAEYLTPSAAKALLEGNKSVHNVTNNITHNVIVRTIALDNIVSINAVGQQVAF